MREQLSDQIPALRRYARMLTGDAWAADDLIQDTLERACRKWTLWTAGSNLRAWLFTLMHHQHVDHIRSSAHHPAPTAVVDVADVAHELAAPLVDTDQQLDLQHSLLRLPPEQRQVLLLVTVEDFSYQEAAQLLGVPVGTVMSRLHRARSRLRELMESGERPGAAAPTSTASAAPHLKRLK
jgi:RNA polymerase sigma factor (sigma-70 family)